MKRTIVVDDLIKRLGARLSGEKVLDTEISLKEIEALMPISERHRQLLVTFGGAILFDNGAKFRINDSSPLCNAKGYLNLLMLFGLGNGSNSLINEWKTYNGELPDGLFPIGEVPGGNLICCDNHGKVFLWNHESMNDEPGCVVASTFDDFLKKLEPDDSGIGSTYGIDESKSFLDF